MSPDLLNQIEAEAYAYREHLRRLGEPNAWDPTSHKYYALRWLEAREAIRKADEDSRKYLERWQVLREKR